MQVHIPVPVSGLYICPHQDRTMACVHRWLLEANGTMLGLKMALSRINTGVVAVSAKNFTLKQPIKMIYYQIHRNTKKCQH